MMPQKRTLIIQQSLDAYLHLNTYQKCRILQVGNLKSPIEHNQKPLKTLKGEIFYVLFRFSHNHLIFYTKLPITWGVLYLFAFYDIMQTALNLCEVQMKFIFNGTSLLPTSPGPS